MENVHLLVLIPENWRQPWWRTSSCVVEGVRDRRGVELWWGWGGIGHSRVGRRGGSPENGGGWGGRPSLIEITALSLL